MNETADDVAIDPVLVVNDYPRRLYGITWSPDGSILVTGADDSTVTVLNAATGKEVAILEGHTRPVGSVSFSHEGSLIASKSIDKTVQIWRSDTYISMGRLVESSSMNIECSIAFHPTEMTLATLGAGDQIIRVWDIDYDALVAVGKERRYIKYTSAKVVIVGETNVGKSCIAMRLAEERYPKDHEQSTTHGMRIWRVDAGSLHPSAKPPKGQRRDVILWDFGGQDEYQLVHQMFLHDTSIAIVLIDPTRGTAALDDARNWNRRLEKHLRQRHAVKILVGAKVDDETKSRLINRAAIDALCRECGFDGFYETSALTGRKIDELRVVLADVFDWSNLAKTSRPELFQKIRDNVEERRKGGEVVVLMDDFRAAIQVSWPKLYEEPAVEAVADQLATQGVIVRTKLAGGNDAIVLQLPVIERYAASLVVAARDNPRAVPALETSELGAPTISLPGMTDGDRVPRSQERVVLEAVAELMIEHGLCFRHEGLLVFPTVLRATETVRTEELPGSVSLHYDFSGAIDNVYASLISWLVLCQGFGRLRLWEDRVEFEAEGQGACGLRKVNRGGGFAHLDVYFHDGTSTRTQAEFTSFVHQHLRTSGINVVEHFELICSNTNCRYEFPRDVVQNRMARGVTDVVCPQCENRIKLSEGFRHERERDEQAERKSFALMTRVRENVSKTVASVKLRAFGRADDEYRIDRPIRILHLSDLHFTKDTTPKTKLQWLHDDICKGNWLKSSELDYVVISGDVTDAGSGPGFLRASEFVSSLIDTFELSAERFILVPGNHDIQILDEAYDWRLRVTEEEASRAVKEGRLYGLPNEKYGDRLKDFSEQFYHPLLQKPYPLDPTRQGVSYIFPETKMQFLTLNSCWEIDQFHPTRASVHPDAVAHLIADADRQIRQSIVNSNVKSTDYLRIGVWHHPVSDAQRGIRNREFLDNLQNNRVRLCLTGDVHEMRRELIDYWHDNQMHVLGAGSFGAKRLNLSEGSPRLYNLLEIDRGFQSIRVHTRQQSLPNGAWKGWNEWPMPDGNEGGLPYFDLQLKQPRRGTITEKQ